MNNSNLLLFLIILCILSMLIVSKVLYSISYLKNELRELTDELHQKESIIKSKNAIIASLRKSNHDNIKHMNLLNEIDRSISDIGVLQNVLHNYIVVCKKYKIDYKYVIDNNIKTKFISYVDLNTIISNIIDNSIKVLNSIEQNNKYIRVNIFEDGIEYCIKILNNGPIIENTEDIFQSGYTTSHENGHGFGLALVRESVDKYNGRIIVESNVITTSFTVIFPKF